MIFCCRGDGRVHDLNENKYRFCHKRGRRAIFVEWCVSVSGATISEREVVVVHVATSDLQDDTKAASKCSSVYYYLVCAIHIIELSLYIYTASNIDYEHFTMDATFNKDPLVRFINR